MPVRAPWKTWATTASTFRINFYVSSKAQPAKVAGPHSFGPTNYFDGPLPQASPDLMRQMLQCFIK